MAISFSTSTVLERLSDRYEVHHPIGQPFGYQQLLASDIRTKQPVVIKSLTIEENTPTGDICCFEREIHLLESLNHPTVPRYIDSFTVDTTPYSVASGTGGKGLILVQGHSGGQTLTSLAARGKTFTESDIKAIAKQLLQGLIYLHDKGLVHRDIKPDNITLTGRDTELGQAAWLNLGTVQYIQAQPKDTLVGTYGYMPPEQVGGQASFASDLFSLGATLVYLVTGTHLGEMPHRSVEGDRTVKFVCPTVRLSAGMQQWLNWLIEPAMRDRPKSARKALAALNHLPLAMLKQRIWKPTKSHLMPIPIAISKAPEEPYFTQIRRIKKRRSSELVVPPVGLRSVSYKVALPPLAMGIAMTSVTLYLFSLLEFSPDMLSSFDGLASIAAASLGVMGGIYAARFLRVGFLLLSKALFRQIHIQIEADVLLISYKYWLRSPEYVVNTRRDAIYNISALPDGGAMRILTHHNRTRSPRDCYKLSLTDGALSHRDIRWLTSLLNEWRRQPGSCA
ncbi:MAG: serine/threonine-protein kinase [Cyanobacteria bacterium J06597_16]